MFSRLEESLEVMHDLQNRQIHPDLGLYLLFICKKSPALQKIREDGAKQLITNYQ